MKTGNINNTTKSGTNEFSLLLLLLILDHEWKFLVIVVNHLAHMCQTMTNEEYGVEKLKMPKKYYTMVQNYNKRDWEKEQNMKICSINDDNDGTNEICIFPYKDCES